MRKIKISFIIITLTILTTLCACNFTPQTKKVNYQNTVLTKNECIEETKRLLKISDLYFFDCDFNNIDKITILDIAHNISVSATLNYNKEDEKYYIDLNEQANIKIITNYKIKTNDACFGFSLIRSVLIPKMNHYKNGEFVKTTPNEIYNQNTYSNVKNLYLDANTTYGSYSPAIVVKTPNNFYPLNTVLAETTSIETKYLHITGNYPYGNYELTDTPIKILTHYPKNADDSESKTIIKNLTDYLYNNAVYEKH